MEQLNWVGTIVQGKDKGVIITLCDEPWYTLLREFAKENELKPGMKISITYETFQNYAIPQARNLYFLIRDRICKASGDPSTEYKEHMRRCLEYDFGAWHRLEDGAVGFKSLKDYTKGEMWWLIEGSLGRLEEAKEQGGVDSRDLRAKYTEIREEDDL